MGLLLLNGDAGFNVRQTLFSQNEQGLWLDPSDMTAGKAGWRRNLLTYSEQADNANWIKTNATITANQAANPENGELTADLLTATADGGSIVQVNTQTAGVVYTQSVWIRSVSGTVSGSIYGSSSFATRTNFTATTSWQRVTNTVVGIGGTRFPSIVLDTNGTSILIWGHQLELGSTPSEYQPITDFSTEFKAAFPTHALYQDSNGVTPCTAAGDPVGLILDQSRGGLGALGPELVTNGGFDADATGWTAANGTTAVSNGKVTITNTAAYGEIYQAFTTVVGRHYVCSINLEAITGSGNVLFFIKSDSTSYSSPNRVDIITGGSAVIKQYSAFFVATATTTYIHAVNGSTGVGASVTVDNISVREVPGNHAYQTSSGARPTLARIPASGRRNLLTYSNDFSNSVWTKNNVTVAKNANGPLGTGEMWTMTDDATNGEHRVFITVGTAVTGCRSIYAKAGTASFIGISHTGTGYTVFNLSTGQKDVEQGTTTGTIESVGDGWHRITMTPTTGGNFLIVKMGETSAQVQSSTTYAGTGKTVLIGGAQYETGSTATNYQKVVATTDVTESGVGDLWHLVFDGSDDSLVTNSISFDTWTQETRRNLLVDTESLSTSNWVSNGGTVTENTTVAPDGTTTADTLTRSTAATEGRYQNVAFTGDGAKSVSVYVKAGTAPSLGVWLWDVGTANRLLAAVDMTGATPIVTLTAGASSAVENVGNGWFRLTFVSTSVTAANTNRLYLMPAYGGASANGQTSIFWGVQAENATASTTYQRVGTDEMTVIAGVRKLSDAADGMLVELGTTSASSGMFYITAPEGALKYASFARGTGAGPTLRADTTGTAPDTCVLSTTHDISGDLTTLRRNGVDATPATGDKGSGNFRSDVIYIGRRAGSSLPFNGHIYQLIIRGKTTPTGKLLEAERYTAKKTGVTGI